MAGVGTEEREYYVPSKKFYPTICLSQIFFIPPKENSKTRLHLRLNMLYVLTLSPYSKAILLLHLPELIFVIHPTVLSSVPTLVINNDPSLSGESLDLQIVHICLMKVGHKNDHKLTCMLMMCRMTITLTFT